MNFNSHSELEGRHAFLSPSKYHWVNYDDEKLDRVFRTSMLSARGTALHELAHNLIELGVKLPATRKTLNMYVNDAIGFRMVPEQPVYYSVNCFGTVDAISFKRNFLRIHDLKTGVTPTSMMQPKVYVAIFCLEYGIKPADIKIELRMYQEDDIEILIPELDEIMHIMDKIITFDKRIQLMKLEV